MIKKFIDSRGKKDMRDVSCMVIDSYNQIDQVLEKEWDELIIRTRSSIYLTCAWSRIWWEFYGKGKVLRIFIFRCDGKLAGVMPIYIEKLWFGFVKTHVARLVGAYNPPRVFDLPILKEYSSAIGEHMVRHIVGTDRCDLISIGPVSDECEAKKVLFAAVEKMTDHLRIARDVPFGVYTYFDLPDTYEAYMRSLSKNERRNHQRYYKKLLYNEDDVRLVVMHEPDEIEAEMPQFIDLHTEQWGATGRPGWFGAWPQSDAFNRRLAVELARLGRTNLIKITVGEEPILYLYSYIFGNCCYAQLSARSVGEKWNRFSLGKTVLVVLIRSAIEIGIKRIEAGQSHYDYKTRLGGKESGISVLRLISRRPSSIAKYHLCAALYKLYYNFYYRFWYTRVQPKLPSFFRRPIWMAYIRRIF